VKPCRKAAGICVVCVCLRIHVFGVGNDAKFDAFPHGDVGAKDAHGGIFIAVDGGTADGGCQVREDVVLVEIVGDHVAADILETQLVLFRCIAHELGGVMSHVVLDTMRETSSGIAVGTQVLGHKSEEVVVGSHG